MTTQTERHLNTGGDPRTLADYAALRDEMNKLTHPARPDVDWHHAETLCLTLFEHNGVELQTAAWYTLARTHLAGLYGMNEGLAILEVLISRQWGNLWPQPVHARIEILSALSKRLQQVMRTLALTYADFSQLYQAEAHLNALGEVLQRLELKHASQLDALRTQMHNAAVRLENSDNTGVTLSCKETPSANTSLTELAEPVKRVYVVQSEPQSDATEMTGTTVSVKPFAAGMMTMLVLAGAAVWGWQAVHQPDPAQVQFTASLTPLPTVLSNEQLQSLRQKSPSPEEGIKHTQQQLAQLSQLKPDWAVSYGDSLVQQALTLWPEQAKPLAQRWQQQMTATALSPESLNGWYQGMQQLQQLTNRLNALDEQKGKYITVSELKSAVFAMTQSFNSTIPLEEQLRQLSAIPEEQIKSAVQQKQAEQHLQQLIARYALLKQKMPEQE
ncbi:type VI secretion system ImpA family N-terminal domain-containing protein [Enterobacter oligotrophicus]|uniref:VasL domain-containing protein n=1 Tax=Enterobacter oligotrophicus TaxID=2478464 RepID=UPI001C00A86E|nr:VasL domain-containing protein [Enterobacter oligotrophicus]ELW1647270.1 type VI secretion system ImpA family N-terminal domain-containing protein [Enterobacter oligotrophicus]MBT9424168.1 type VI secretion system ImpA family N-terminal domain-containing protein [Enterobacter oligotrophicus]